ncbi:Telomeric repeat-binding factor 1 [Glycine soja]|uniref:Telomeric repeat-binding factor 1 n=1 Tax=Glycine soja TaxID=3848 RepID=A0A0B2QBN8_GLYSO|nr:Telomeric repeat-binding factor 1 [Glycine soja]
MNSDISRWVMEFLLRSSVPDSLIQKTLTALPLSPAEPRLKKNLLLRTLQTLLRRATLSETALDILEDLSPISNVNTARTAQSPWSAPSSTSPRALTLSMAKDALGEDSKETRERLAGLNSRRDAMNEVRVYLKEAWEMMGPSFLETVAATEKKNDEGACDNGSGNGNDDDHDDGACMEDVAMHYENQEPLEESVDANQEVGGSDLTPQRDKAILKRNPQLKHKHSAFRASHKGRGIKISSPEEVESTKPWRKHDPVPSAEVKKIRESLKSSSSELQALVNDPLPDALHISDVVRSKLATSDTKIEPPIENQHEDVEVQDPDVCLSIVPFQPNDVNLGKKSSVHCSNIHQPSLMERNRSARTFEWEDSIDNSQQARQPRRRKRKWSSLEEETLRAGVKMFGEGNWATIRSFYSNIFENRSGVDLKDKWRNMIR